MWKNIKMIINDRGNLILEVIAQDGYLYSHQETLLILNMTTNKKQGSFFIRVCGASNYRSVPNIVLKFKLIIC